MITGTIVKGAKLRLILEGTDEIDSSVLEQLNGATCTLITDNLRLGDKNISGGIIIEKKEHERRTEAVVPDTGTGDRERLLPGTDEQSSSS